MNKMSGVCYKCMSDTDFKFVSNEMLTDRDVFECVVCGAKFEVIEYEK